jgi:ABC-type transporter Mla MlaB component
MLRVTTSDLENARTLKVEGRVKGPWVLELKKAWLDSVGLVQGQPVRVDLSGVSFADAEGRNLLLQMQKEGAILLCPSAYIQEVLELASDKSTKSSVNEWEA